MKIRTAVLVITIAVASIVGGATTAMAETSVTAGAGGIFPAGTTFNGVPLNGLQSGYGVEISDSGSALGEFCVVLLGVSVLGVEQRITVAGLAAGGSRTASNISTFSGTCSVDMGDGTPPLTGVPFTATITTNADDQGMIGLVLGQTTLPTATVEQGTMTIK